MTTTQPIPTPAASASHPPALPSSTPPASVSASSYSRSPPRPLLSPLLSRTAFNLPTPAVAAHQRSRSFSSSPPDENGPATPVSSPPSLQQQAPQLGSSFSGAPLGRVPSAGYGSYGASSGYALGRVPSGNSAAMMAYSPETEHKAMGLLRRFSLSGSGAVKPAVNSAPATQQIGFERHGRSASVASNTSATSATGAAAEPRSAPTMLDPTLAAQSRGRKGSVGGNGKRRPSPMGERLLMGHFNAH